MNKDIFPGILGALLLAIMPGTTQEIAPQGWHLVAADVAGDPAQRAHFSPGTGYHTFTMNPGGALETVAYSRPLVLSYGGMNPEMQYKVRFTFIADHKRTQTVTVDGNPLVRKFTLEAGTPKVIEQELPKLAFMYGEMHLSIECPDGPNAVVSRVEIFSTDKRPLKRAETKGGADTADFSGTVSAGQLAEVLPVLTPRPTGAITDLSGTWKFIPAIFPGFEQAPWQGGGRDIAVPGEWAMQGFTVEPGRPAGYFRTFNLDAKPASERVKLRFSSVHSLCQVFVNGRPAGGHEGGFVPFECDITEAARAGTNTLALSVQSESMADDLACGSQYAAHPLGGINRKVELFTVPDIHISDAKVETRFDDRLVNATLIARVAVRNQSKQPAAGYSLDGLVAGARGEVRVPTVPAGGTASVELKIPVKAPAKWDCEHPNLHSLRLGLRTPEGVQRETVDVMTGFRQVEVKGSRVFVNGKPIKLRGVCRHEAHPLLGRSLNEALWKADAKIYREMNCNFIRTSHYPPAEEFLAECDRLGLFVELEAPVCWVGHGASDVYKPGYKPTQAILDRVLRANLETIQAHANNPSVIIRSLANESGWNPMFRRVHEFAKLADGTRPYMFHDQCWGGFNNQSGGALPIGNYHYPGMDGPAAADKEARPIQFGEYCHLNTYNRREIMTDPGVRDYYGAAIAPMWELMHRHAGNLGGSIWSGIDDVFLLPDGRAVGYGEWGPIDGWRRLKPEAWHIKKAYSPVRVMGAKAANGRTTVEIENRFLYSDLSETKVEWAVVPAGADFRKAALTTAAASLAPGGKGTLVIPAESENPLYLRFTAADGVVLDEELVPAGRASAACDTSKPVGASATLKITESGEWIQITGDQFEWRVDRNTGAIRHGKAKDRVVIAGGPSLMMLPLTSGAGQASPGKKIEPLNSVCANWRAKSVKLTAGEGLARIAVEGGYDEAAGSYTLTFGKEGSLKVDYAFRSEIEMNPRQWGMVFGAPRALSRITWVRDGIWSVYPEGHIGRTAGTATAGMQGRDPLAGRTPPPWPWELDENLLGSADFRSTRANIRWFRLDDPENGAGFRVESDGRQSARAWRVNEAGDIGLLVAGFNTGGGDGFLAGAHYAREYRRIAKHGEIRDGILIRLIERP